MFETAIPCIAEIRDGNEMNALIELTFLDGVLGPDSQERFSISIWEYCKLLRFPYLMCSTPSLDGGASSARGRANSAIGWPRFDENQPNWSAHITAVTPSPDQNREAVRGLETALFGQRSELTQNCWPLGSGVAIHIARSDITETKGREDAKRDFPLVKMVRIHFPVNRTETRGHGWNIQREREKNKKDEAPATRTDFHKGRNERRPLRRRSRKKIDE